MTNLNSTYWQNRYDESRTGWDLGNVSRPHKEYIDQLEDKNVRILIPGAGPAHEAEYLWQLGFKNVTVADYAATPLENLKSRVPDFPSEQLIQDDFFKLTGNYDLILEQTFFCAIDPSLRGDYMIKMHELLATGGKLVGVLFNHPLTEKGPPYGGEMTAYCSLFRTQLEVLKMENCYNSIPDRAGDEYFFICQKTH